MSEPKGYPGAACNVPLLERILAELSTGGYPGGPEVAGGRRQFVKVLTERRDDGITPYESFLFVFPENTDSVSVTGDVCSLDCAHCDGHYLKKMTTLSELEELLEGDAAGGPRSWLMSGGCNSTGTVPVPPEHVLQKLSEIGRLNFHVGLAGDEQIEAAARYADVVSFDMIGCDETISRVMGLDHGFSDYLRVYRRLRSQLPDNVPVVPHVVVGLDGGRICGEYRLIDALAREEPEALVFLILRPTPGTRFENASPPSLTDVRDVMLHARSVLPRTRLHLGCMRPSGQYRAAVDLLAAACDFDVLVQPTLAARRILLEELGPEHVSWGDECCDLYVGTERLGPVGPYDSLRAFRRRFQ